MTYPRLIGKWLFFTALMAPAALTPVRADSPPVIPQRGAKVPFVTLEAESAVQRTTGKVVRMEGLPARTTINPEMEASGRGFVSLADAGAYVEFPKAPAANTIVVRHCIPDAPEGGGRTATLSLYVNGKRRQALSLSSKHNWLYGEPGQNGQSDDPKAGAPHVFWDESRFFITGGIKAGDTVRLQKDAADTAEYYRIDLIDLETAPDPLRAPAAGTFLSVTDFGANGADTADDTQAIQACLDAAKERKKSVWIPAGTYYQSARLTVDGVAVRGAGMWHTNLVGTAAGTGWGGAPGFTLRGDGPAVSDLFLDSTVHTRRGTPGGRGFTGDFNNCKNWRVENVWMAHLHVGFWMSGASDGAIRNCRVRFTYADAINLNRGSRDCVVENCHIRGSGDDGIAILSEMERTPTPSANITLRSNTVVATWWGHNLDVAGGGGHVVENNHLADNPFFGVLTINLPGAYPMYPLTGATIRRNTILRGGGNYVDQRRGAIWIYAGSTTTDNTVFEDNDVFYPIFRGIHVTGGGVQNITFARNRIVSPGQDAIAIDSAARGSGTFRNNTVTGLKPEYKAFVPDGGDDYAVTQTGNSWQ